MQRPVRDGIAKRELGLSTTEFDKIMKIASERKDVISLGPGEPDFITPKKIRDVVTKAMNKGYTHYTPPDGLSEFKEAIAKKLKHENKIDVDPNSQIIVACGSTEALFLGILVLIDPTESVLVPDPGFISYRPAVELLHGIAVSVPLLEKDGFQFNPEKVKELISPKTRILIINSPSNPTGRVLRRRVLEEIADIAIEHGLVIFSDEAYEKFVYAGAKHVSIGGLNGMENYVVTFQTFSKTFAMPAFRIGYAVGPKDIIKAMVRCHLYTTLCAPSFVQYAGPEIFRISARYVEKMRKEYDRRRKMLCKKLNEIPEISCLEPEGAFYAFPNITQLRMSSLKFSKFLLEKAKVLVVPGTEFGKCGEGFIRLSYATAYEKIEEAMDRIEEVIKNIK
jgi:aminotransferase